MRLRYMFFTYLYHLCKLYGFLCWLIFGPVEIWLYMYMELRPELWCCRWKTLLELINKISYLYFISCHIYVMQVEASDNGGFITQSNITFIANRSDHAAEYMCQASNHELHGVVYKSINLDVACKIFSCCIHSTIHIYITLSILSFSVILNHLSNPLQAILTDGWHFTLLSRDWVSPLIKIYWWESS